MSQNHLKVQAKQKVGKRRPADTDFWRFLMILGVPRRGQQCTKMPSKNRSKKRRQKRRRRHPSGARVGGHRAARRNARFLLGKEGFCKVNENKSTARQHSRRSAADLHGYAISADPWKITIMLGKQPETKQARLGEASSQRPSRPG